MDYQHIKVACAGAVGAHVDGVDLADLSDAALAELRAAFAQYSVLFFKGQNITPEQHIEFAQRWGEINVNRFFTPVPEFPNITLVQKEPEQKFNIGGAWHTDHSYDEIPALGSMLYAREVPAVGGDTLFASTCAAYDSLSDGLKATLSKLEAVHSTKHVFGENAKRPDELNDRLGNQAAATQEVCHPMVITHPLSKRKSLYVNPGFVTHIKGWSPEESQSLLSFLYQHVSRPEHTYRFKWSAGAMAFWDNRATWHWAVNDYHGQRRLMHRITLEGEPIAA